MQPPTTNLQPGMTGPQVTALQQYLVSQGLMTQAQMNTGPGTYGPQTTAAVKALQQKLGVNNSSGPGYYGPQTIAAVQKSGSSSSSSPSASSLTGSPSTSQSSSSTANAINKSPNPGETITIGQYTVTGNSDGTATVKNSSTGAQVGTLDSQNNFSINTGDANTDASIDNAGKYLTQQIQAGNQVNPALAITPALTAQFLQEAHSQMDPQTQQQLTDTIQGINASLQNQTTQYNNSVAQAQQNFQQSLNQERNATSAAGISFSGERGLAENQLLNSQNIGLSTLAANAQNQIGATLRSGGAAVGQGIPGLNGSQSDFQVPSLSAATSTLSGAYGGAGPTGNALNLNYNPGTYQVGNIGVAYGQGINSAAQQQQSNYLGSAANNSPSAAANGPTAASLS